MRLRQMVLDHLHACGSYGATDEEIIAALELPANTIRARRCELHDACLAMDSGRTRLTIARRDAVVWVHHLWAPTTPILRKTIRSTKALRQRILVLEDSLRIAEIRFRVVEVRLRIAEARLRRRREEG